MTEQWQELKETIIEMRDNDGTGTQQEVCKFLANLMDVLEKQMQEPAYCDRNICLKNEYTGIGCDECEVTKSQEPCEDAISREDVIDLKWQGEASEEFLEGYASAIEDARVLPPVNPQEKTGHWITLKDEYGDVHEAVCSNCDSNGNHKWTYCPKCGTKMQEENI